MIVMEEDGKAKGEKEGDEGEGRSRRRGWKRIREVQTMMVADIG